MGIIDRDLARVRPAFRGQRIDRAALKWREHFPHLHSARGDRICLHWHLSVAQRAGRAGRAGEIAQHYFRSRYAQSDGAFWQ